MTRDRLAHVCTMDNIFELLFTIVVGIFWLFGSQLFKNRDDSDSDRPAQPQRKKKREGEPMLTDFDQRQREIREAIRRKIAERRQETKPEPTTAREPAQARLFSLDDGDTYEQEMQQRLQAIESTKRKAEALREQAAYAADNDYAEAAESTERSEGAVFTGPVRSALKNPRAARAAFIDGEVLGKPVALRQASGRGFEA